MKRIGWQTYPTEKALTVFRVYPPPFLKILDPQLNMAIAEEITRSAIRMGIPVAWRFVKFFDDRNPSGRLDENPAMAARADYNELRPATAGLKGGYLEIFNEPATDAVTVRWMRDYLDEARKLWAWDGIRLIGYNFAMGADPQGDLYVPNVVVGFHEYADHGDPKWGWLMLRYLRYISGRTAVAITETGSEPRHEGLTLELMREYDRRLARDVRVLGAAFFLLDAPFDAWHPYRMPEAWYPAFKMEEAPMSTTVGSIVKGIDLSAWSGIISPDWARQLVEAEIEVAVIQLAGSTPKGWGVNPFAFQQAFVLDDAGLRLGAYIWPPRAILDRNIQLFADAFCTLFKTLFLALDVEGGEGVTREHVKAAAVFTRPVIYTGPAAWRAIMGNSTEFADVDLWEANYLKKFITDPPTWPTEEDRPWSPVTKGGWGFSPAWQFRGNTNLFGVPVDLNVFYRPWLDKLRLT